MSVGRNDVGVARAPAGRCSRRSTGRCPGAPAAGPRRRRGRRPRSSGTSPVGRAPRTAPTRARPAARGIGSDAGSSPASVAASGNRWRRARPAGSARRGQHGRRARRPGGAGCVRRAGQTDTCWPSTALTATSSPSTCPGTRRPGRAADERRRAPGRRRAASSTATGSQSRSSSRRQRSTAAPRSRRSASRRPARTPSTPARGGRSARHDRAGAVRQRAGCAAYVVAGRPPRRRARRARRGRRSSVAPANGVADGEPQSSDRASARRRRGAAGRAARWASQA